MNTPTAGLPPLPEPFLEMHQEISPVVYKAWADQMHAYALAAIACQGDAWQPIETAPEGELVLVYAPPQSGDYPDDVRIKFDYICPDYEGWHDHCASYEHYMAVGGSNACGPDVVCTGPTEKAPYTHWRRIPLPPAITAKDTP